MCSLIECESKEKARVSRLEAHWRCKVKRDFDVSAECRTKCRLANWTSQLKISKKDTVQVVTLSVNWQHMSLRVSVLGVGLGMFNWVRKDFWWFKRFIYQLIMHLQMCQMKFLHTICFDVSEFQKKSGRNKNC